MNKNLENLIKKSIEKSLYYEAFLVFKDQFVDTDSVLLAEPESYKILIPIYENYFLKKDDKQSWDELMELCDFEKEHPNFIVLNQDLRRELFRTRLRILTDYIGDSTSISEKIHQLVDDYLFDEEESLY